MRAKKIVCFFIALLLFSISAVIVDALPTTTLSFRGAGVTIDLTFPEEAHPNATITHNVTITAHTDLTLQSFTLFIYAPINSSLQEIKNRTITWDFLENETLTSRIEFDLPQNTNGTLYCVMTVQTDQTTDYSSYKFYTAHVSDLTFSEMQSLYKEMLANYTSLQADYSALLNEYDGLLADYGSLFADYTALLSQYNSLSTQYDSQVLTYQQLLATHNKLSDDYDALDSIYRSKLIELSELQSDYSELNATRNSLQANYTTLRADYIGLNQTFNDLLTDRNNLQTDFSAEQNTNRIVMFIFVITLVALIAFVIYLKRGKEEPYVVIRKETVSVNPEESSEKPS